MRVFGLPDFEANALGFDGDSGDHAGKVETSLLWALEPDCVDMSRLPDERTGSEPNFAMGPDARLADRRIGERMVDDEVSWLGNKARELLAEYAAQPDRERKPLSFLETEEVWSRHIVPRLSDFQSMQYLDREAPPAGSRWELNYVLPQEGTYA